MEKRKSVFYEPFFTDVRMGKYEVLTYESGKYENRYMKQNLCDIAIMAKCNFILHDHFFSL